MLDILICSIKDRHQQLTILLNEFRRQGAEPITLVDNREMSVGAKRQKLLEMATQPWIVFFDDDDWPSEKYYDLILKAIESDPGADCCGIWGKMTTDGRNPKTWCHRLGYPIAERQHGFDYVRPIIHFNPVRTQFALKAGFKDMRWGEDMDYANRLNPLLKREVFIKEPLFLYRYSTKVPHKIKYGIK